MAFTHFLKELASGFPSSSYLLYSGDYHLVYEAFMRIKETLGSDAFNFDIFDGDSADSRPTMDAIIDTLNTLPFGSLKRTVVVRNLQKYPKGDYKKIESYLNRPSEFSLLFMLYEGKIPKSFETASAAGTKKISLTVADQEIIPFLLDKSKLAGLDLDRKTAEYLISFVGSELGSLCAEIEKLSTLGKSTLTADGIRSLVYSDIEYTAFDLASAIDRGNAREVFSILEQIEKSAEPHMILGALNWHYKNMRGKGRQDEEMRTEMFRLLHCADVALKTSRGAVLEELLYRILQTMQASRQMTR